MSGAGDLESRKRDAEDCKNKGNEFLKQKDYDSAIQWYNQVWMLFIMIVRLFLWMVQTKFTIVTDLQLI